MLTNIFVYWLGILPLIVYKGHYEVPKVFIFLLGGFFLTLFWSWKSMKVKREDLFNKKDYIFLLWLLILFVAGLLGANPLQSILGGSYRYQGFIFFLTLFLTGKTISILNSSKKNLLQKVVASTLLIEGLLIVFQVLSGNTYFGKPLGTLGEASAVAGFLAIGSYFVLQVFPKIFPYILSIPILLTISRAGILSYSIILFNSLIKRFKPVIVILVVGTLFILLQLSKGKSLSTFENRPLIWTMATEAIREQPFIGYGTESQERIYDLAFAKREIPLLGLIVDRAHNIFLDITIWTGFLGLIVFLTWIWMELKDIKDSNRKIAIFAFFVFASLQPLSVVHWILLIFLFNI